MGNQHGCEEKRQQQGRHSPGSRDQTPPISLLCLVLKAISARTCRSRSLVDRAARLRGRRELRFQCESVPNVCSY